MWDIPKICVCCAPPYRKDFHILFLARTHCKRFCCILRGPGWEHILDIVPRGTELGTQVKTGSLAGRTHSQ